MLAAQAPVERRLALLVLFTPTLCLLLVVFVACGAATMEFERKWVPEDPEYRKDFRTYSPIIYVFYSDVYAYAWGAPVLAVIWAAWLLRKPYCSLRSLALYVAILCVFITFWVLFTLLAFYLGNQTFCAGG